MATLDLLQASMVAVNSDSFWVFNANPPENRMTILRPGTLRRFFARLRTASSMLRAPKSASAVLREVSPEEATVTGWLSPTLALGFTEEFFTPATAERNRSALALKFCTMRRAPPKSTTAIKWSALAFAAINLLAALRA